MFVFPLKSDKRRVCVKKVLNDILVIGQVLIEIILQYGSFGGTCHDSLIRGVVFCRRYCLKLAQNISVGSAVLTVVLLVCEIRF